MFKDVQGAINVGHSINCAKSNARINLTLLN